jgi:haloalkane dehalogenase
MINSRFLVFYIITLLLGSVLAKTAVAAEEVWSWDEARRLSVELPAVEFQPHYKSKFVTVKGHQIHYMEAGKGDPIVFVHGNPEAPYIWRNIMPYLEKHGRVLAPALIGMGKSDKPDLEYNYSDFYEHLVGWIEALDLKNITFVIHDWGSVMGLDYTRQHPDNVKGVAMMETLIMPAYPINDPEAFRKVKPSVIAMYERNKSGAGYDDVVVGNLFIEMTLPGHTLRRLRQAEMIHYREPFKDPKNRKPLLQWPKLIPIKGEPKETHDVITAINEWLPNKKIPTLHLYGEPGDVNSVEDVMWLAERLQDHQTQYIGPGLHFVQEDHPKIIGSTIADWYRRNISTKKGGQLPPDSTE